ncbi:MAG: mannose-1-phosphate guanylyltransferase/mannose-6-phosphate isomerase [Candidatus Paracaedibacteraceae bacterium]|nr:mannose-1-phosphate guanylyltransferase/mannose-6-phosphate isomerase [Candidatus Paracaedibacteraceae bacterium]
MHLIPTVLCGGAGSRLWPVSREHNPKPFIRLDDGQSLIQKAFLRGALLNQVSDILTVTNREFFFRVEDDYAELDEKADHIQKHFILEPFGRNTAPAIAAASLYAVEKISADAILLVLAADHLVLDQAAFEKAVLAATKLAEQDRIVTFGITPKTPETGYGYIEFKNEDVLRFVEKPDYVTAKSYVDSGNFLWNSGIFCFKASKMLEEMGQYCPEILNETKKAIESAGFSEGFNLKKVDIHPQDFETVPSDSIDYSIMEKTKSASVIACDIGWSDIGCWRSLGDLIQTDELNNRISGEALLKDTKNCTILAKDRVIGAVGLDSLIIVDTADALLVVDKKATQDVKSIFNILKTQNNDVHKLHRTANRPWGTYTVLEEAKGFKIKRIEVKPGGRLSLQMHAHRSEHWVVVSGVAKIINGDQEIILNVNESTYIPATHKHRLENIGTDMLILIEVQTGTYLGEDDIIRFDDVYGRAVL